MLLGSARGEEAVQGAGVGFSRLRAVAAYGWYRSCGWEDHTCPEEEETGHKRMRPRVKKAKPTIPVLPAGLRLSPVGKRLSGDEPPAEKPGRARKVVTLRALRRGATMDIPPEPPLETGMGERGTGV